MKKLFFLTQGVLFIAFNISLLLTAYQVAGPADTNRINYKPPVFNHLEEYDPSLSRLNSLSTLAAYCDSIYAVDYQQSGAFSYDEKFPDIASAVVRKRFYHGYSVYGFNDNFMAMAFSSMANAEGLSAIVLPDDMLKFPYAACSQQSIILMELLRQKGFTTRKVGFKGKTYGHFCFEVYYKGGWHFYDADMEPNTTVMTAYNHPDIQFLATHKDVLLKAYAQYPTEKVLDIFPNYFYGAVNKFPAPYARMFQKGTKILSYTIWLVFLGAFVLARRKYKKMGARKPLVARHMYTPRLQHEAMAFYTKYSA